MALLEQQTLADPTLVLDRVGAILQDIAGAPWVGKAKMQVYCHVMDRLFGMYAEEGLNLHNRPLEAAVGDGHFFVGDGVGQVRASVVVVDIVVDIVVVVAAAATTTTTTIAATTTTAVAAAAKTC